MVDVQPADEAGSVTVDFTWSVDVDGSSVAEDSRTITRRADNDEWLRDEFEVYSDADHRYSVRIRIRRVTAHLEILATFIAPRQAGHESGGGVRRP